VTRVIVRSASVTRSFAAWPAMTSGLVTTGRGDLVNSHLADYDRSAMAAQLRLEPGLVFALATAAQSRPRADSQGRGGYRELTADCATW